MWTKKRRIILWLSKLTGLIDKVKIMQNDVITLEPKLIGACVPPEKSHLSLYVFYTQNVDKVIEIVSEVIANYKFDSER